MKKLTSILLTLCLMLSLFALAANAAEKISVTVTIADKTGALVLAAEAVEVRDVDGDSLLTVHDTLTCAHEQYYGSADGYKAVALPGYQGLSLEKLWGQTNSYSFGYYCNNASCWSLLDPVKDGDKVTAFAYTDLKAFSDAYTFCQPDTAAVKTGEVFQLTFHKAGYDEKWNPIVLPVAGATVTVDGKATKFVTDENGEVEIFLLKKGEHIVSVTSGTETLVPCAVRVQTSFSVFSFVLGLFRTAVNWVMNLINK